MVKFSVMCKGGGWYAAVCSYGEFYASLSSVLNVVLLVWEVSGLSMRGLGFAVISLFWANFFHFFAHLFDKVLMFVCDKRLVNTDNMF